MSRAAVRARLRAAASRASAAALAAVEPGARVRAAIEAEPGTGRCRILALGKGAEAMVQGALAALGERVCGGVAVVPARECLPRTLGPVELSAGSHPLPDERSAAAGRRLLAEAASLADGESALVLLSGGASALATVPREGATVEGLASLTAELLRSGLPIAEINRRRATLSRLHAGGLSAAIGAHPARTLALSDVPGDEPRDIGSAPMHEDSPAGSRRFEIIASGGTAARAAAASLRSEGFLVELDTELLVGEAEREAESRLRRLEALGSGARALVSHGEPVVRVKGAGAGGRNTHAALAFALRLDSRSEAGVECVLLALATDGVDGGSHSAGALVDRGTVQRIQARGRAPRADLAGLDSSGSLAAAGDLLPENPTGGNVADSWIAIRDEVSPRLVPLEACPGLRLSQAGAPPLAALLVRSVLRRRLVAMGAGLHGGSGLVISGAWHPQEPRLADGLTVEIAALDAEAIAALRDGGLHESPLGTGLWRLEAEPAPMMAPSWEEEA